MATATITRKGEDRVRAGHPWIYRSDVIEVNAAPGDIVAVTGSRGRTIGHALFSDRSEIVLRMISHGEQTPPESFWRDRLAEAIAYRDSLALDATAYRLVHGEADRLPSLIVDRYGDYLVVQALSQGIDRRLPEITAALVKLARPAGILARNDPRVRLLEGLEQKVEALHGEVPQRLEVREGGIAYEMDPWKGQKTGLFLDQREGAEAPDAGGLPGDLQLLVQRERGDVPRRGVRGRRRRVRGDVARREARPGARPSDPDQRPRDLLPQVPYSEEVSLKKMEK